MVVNDSRPPEPNARWHRLTPDRLVVGLLLGQVLLFSADRFGWFGLKTGSGWNVLFAVALVVLTVLLGVLWLGASLLLRRRYQFSLRSLFLLLLIVAGVSSWFAVKRQRATRQREAVAVIGKAGGGFAYDWEVKNHWEHWGGEPPIPALLLELLGIDFFSDVVIGYCGTRTFGDDDMIHLKELTSLKELSLCDAQITDAGMKHLRQLTNLVVLDLSYCPHVSEAGLRELEGLTKLRSVRSEGMGFSRERFELWGLGPDLQQWNFGDMQWNSVEFLEFLDSGWDEFVGGKRGHH